MEIVETQEEWDNWLDGLKQELVEIWLRPIRPMRFKPFRSQEYDKRRDADEIHRRLRKMAMETDYRFVRTHNKKGGGEYEQSIHIR